MTEPSQSSTDLQREVEPGSVIRVVEFAGRTRPVWMGLAGIAAAVLTWQVLVATEVVSPLTVPRPRVTGARVLDLMVDDTFQREMWDTLTTWGWAMFLAGVVAIPLGLLIGHIRVMDRPSSLVVHAARSVPSTALIPVAILSFGLGTSMKTSVVVYAVFFPMLLNAIYGARAVDPMMRTVALSLRFSHRQVLWRVVLPSAAPSIATGIRISSAIGLIVVYGTELLGATTGAGVVIIRYQQLEPPRIDFVYAGIVLIGAVGLIVSMLLSALERLLIPWASSAERARR